MAVALTGFMACGKTTFGKAAAALLGWRFIDLDKEIEAACGPVTEIFEQGGEPLFRELETRTLESVMEESKDEDCIIALGGGTVLSDVNTHILRKNGTFLIWLDTSFDIILSELSNAERPLVQKKSTEDIRALFDIRRKRYEECSDAIVRIDSTDYKSAVEHIAAVARDSNK